MHPSSRTIYRLADNPRDFGACHEILDLNQMPHWTLHYPTVVAVRDGKIIGFLATGDGVWCHLVGPLALRSPSAIVALRLVEAYEVVMRAMGVTRYCFFISKDESHAKWRDSVERLGLQPIKQNNENIFYERILTPESVRLAA